MNYTKGKWAFNNEFWLGGGYIVTAPKQNIAEVFGDTLEQGEANARLIAAAPAMYEALKKASELCDLREFAGGAPVQYMVDAAIKAAEGKE
jgi:hypothetical protein